MMRSLLNIRIKAFKIWQLGALVLLAIIISCCATDVTNLNQPAAGTVNKPVQISFTITYCTPESAQAHLVIALLLPVGWQGQKNMTMSWSCQTIGSGVLTPMPSGNVEKQSGIPWPQALINKFGLVNNYVNNMQWVVFQTPDQYNMGAATTPVNVTITLTPGADNKDADVNMDYVIAESNDGLADPDTYLCGGHSYEYYEILKGGRFTLTGGAPNSEVDYADPQYGTVTPGAALIDDYITITFNGAATSTPTALLNAPQVYLHATAYATDGTAYPVNEQTAKTLMAETSSTSNTYKLTLWPRQFFGFPSTKTLDHISYIFTDATGTVQVGFNNQTPLTPFNYQFFCQ